MKNYRYNSARVALSALGRTGVMEASYSGPMTMEAFECLRSDVIRASGNAHGLVLRLDRMADAMGDLVLPPPTVYRAGSPPGAVIVREDQYDKWVSFNRELAKRGVMRSVWLESHAALAYEWVLHQSSVALQELQQ